MTRLGAERPPKDETTLRIPCLAESRSCTSHLVGATAPASWPSRVASREFHRAPVLCEWGCCGTRSPALGQRAWLCARPSKLHNDFCGRG